MNVSSGIKGNWELVWSLDLKALAMARISLGLILIFDLISRFNQAEILYGANAMVPPSMIKGSFPFVWNLYLLSDNLWFTKVLLILTIASAFSWMIGYRAKSALAITWFLYASLFFRNTLIHSGAEPTLLGALFWLMWLPHSHTWSLDSNNKGVVAAACLGAGSVAFVLQIIIYYLFSGLHKHDPIWWQQGSALYYALNLDTFVSPAGRWLLNYPFATHAFSFAVWWLEVLAPVLLLLLPLLFGRRLRTLAVIALIGMHIGIAVFMQIGIFPYVNMAILLALLPISRKNTAPPLYWNRRESFVLIPLLALVCSQIAFATFRYAQHKPPRLLRTVLQLTTLENPYRFFAPKPPLQERFWFFLGTTEAGREVDVYALSESRPDLSKQSAIDRWGRFHQRYFTHWARKGKRGPKLRAQFADYLCHRWNKQAPALRLPAIVSVTLKYQLEVTAEWHSDKLDFVYIARGHKYRCNNS